MAHTSSAFRRFAIAAIILCCGVRGLRAEEAQPSSAQHSFAIGETDFLFDGKPMVIRTGEMHFTRVPREYWRNRLQLLKSMGMNTVCAYLFWNYHEFEPGKFDWADQADAAAFCRMAQEKGLLVVLRPGPYVCAEWDGGGLPWWLLKKPNIKLRSQDPDFLSAATAWYKEVGRVLAPLQITHGGPIIMAQVENEYGSFGNDAEYIGKLRQALVDSGIHVPLFLCNPPGDLRKGARADLFNVVNFGRDPQTAFRRLRDLQPKGPLMCGEFYPGWFDTWGAPHHLGNNRQFLTDLEYMLREHASFSLYMSHGGTTPGMWPGVDRPFKPDTNSYDYDAPISEAGGTGEKFQQTRNLIAKYLPEGEKLPDPPATNPVMAIPTFKLNQSAAVFDNLPAPIEDSAPRNMEAYDQGHGCMMYRTQLPAGPVATLQVDQLHDFAWVFLDGKQIGMMDRRTRRFSVKLPAREKPAQLDLLVEAMGHVNFGNEIQDRKGIVGAVKLVGASEASLSLESPWQIFRLPLDAPELNGLKWKTAAASGPAFWRGTFTVAKPADTYLDLRNWGKGVVWVNGRCLARYWNIGPTQTAYLPGPFLKSGENEIVILDLVGPTEPTVAGLEKPILDVLRSELDFSIKPTTKGKLTLEDKTPIYKNTFKSGADVQEVKFPEPVTGKQFCIESHSAHDGKQFAAIAELDLLDADGKSIPHQNWTIAYVDSEELAGEDGSASNAIDGQSASFWHTPWKDSQPNHPHQLVIDLGSPLAIGGFRYTPRAGSGQSGGRIKDYSIYVGEALATPAKATSAK